MSDSVGFNIHILIYMMGWVVVFWGYVRITVYIARYAPPFRHNQLNPITIVLHSRPAAVLLLSVLRENTSAAEHGVLYSFFSPSFCRRCLSWVPMCP